MVLTVIRHLGGMDCDDDGPNIKYSSDGYRDFDKDEIMNYLI